MKEESLNTELREFKRNITDSLCDFIFSISENITSLSGSYSESLIKLLAVLKRNQDDTFFVYEEGKALAQYYISKGCTKQELASLVKAITDYLE